MSVEGCFVINPFVTVGGKNLSVAKIGKARAMASVDCQIFSYYQFVHGICNSTEQAQVKQMKKYFLVPFICFSALYFFFLTLKPFTFIRVPAVNSTVKLLNLFKSTTVGVGLISRTSK